MPPPECRAAARSVSPKHGAGAKEPVVHTVARARTSLELEALDLTASPESILEQVGDLANKIRRMRSARVGRGEVSAG